MNVLKNKKFIISISSLLAIVLVACLSYGIVASWLTKETLQSSVEISLLLQGDEADIYESPVTLTSKGTYELATVGTKDTDGNYVGNDVGVGEKPEPSRKNYYDYVMPGVNIPKDPKVFITKKSGAPAYLYIEVFEHNFPEYFTKEGFEELGVNNPEQNPNEVKPIYYYLEDYWTPVYTAEGKQAVGVNGGALYVYYNENDYFKTNNYNQNFTIEIGAGSEKETINQGATYLSSYIMKNESTGPDKIDKQQYYGTNEVKTVDGQPMDCPYFNILKEDTVYVSEKYIHPEYYSKLYSNLAEKTVTKEGHDFGLYFFSYMASAKVDGTYASPFEAYEKAGFMEEEAYLMYLYESTDKSESVEQERIVYVWEDHLYTKSQGKISDKGIHDAVKDYFGDGKPYKIVLMESLEVESDINVSAGSNFVLDMNGKILSATEGIAGSLLNITVNNAAVEITGNGTFYMGNTLYRRAISVAKNAKLVIRNGNFIREYDETRTGQEAFDTPLINKGSSGSYIYIYDGYFDNGYWSLEDTIADFFNSKNPQNLLPLYDTKTGKGWLMHEDGSYLTIDPKGDIYKIETDENGMMKWTQLENKYGLVYAWPKGRGDYIYKDDSGYYKLVYFNGTNYTAIDSKNVNNTVEESKLERLYLESTEDGNWTYTLNGKVTNVYKIYPERVKLITQKLDNPAAYVRVLDEKGNYVVDENGKYKLEKLDSYDKIYGPCPYGIATALGSGGSVGANEHFLVYGGTFVVQNPLWGDEVGMQQHYAESQMICPEEYNPQRLLNPWYLLWTADIDNSYLHGQIVWQDEGLIDEYNIAESSMLRTYVDENGEIKSFYVPVYTVNYSGEIPD